MDDETARANLAAEAARLVAARAALERERTEIQGEQAMDPHTDGSLLEREVDDSMLHQLDSELRDVEAALRRLASGAYGRCEVCGAPIGDERLRAVPAASRCTSHQEAAEISIEARLIEGSESPIGAEALSAREGAHNLDLVPSDEVESDEEGDQLAGAEDLAVHVRES